MLMVKLCNILSNHDDCPVYILLHYVFYNYVFCPSNIYIFEKLFFLFFYSICAHDRIYVQFLRYIYTITTKHIIFLVFRLFNLCP